MNSLTEDFSSSLKLLESHTNSKLPSHLIKNYEVQIQELSSKLFQADSLVKNLMSSQEKLKSLLSSARLENSTLVLLNRKLKNQIASLAGKCEDEEMIQNSLSEPTTVKDFNSFQPVCPRCANDQDLTRITNTQLNIEKGKSFLFRGRRRLIMNFCIVEHQYEICVLGRKVKRVRFPKECYFEISKTLSTGIRVNKPIRKIKFQGTVSVIPNKGKRLMVDWKLTNSSNFSTLSRQDLNNLSTSTGLKVLIKPIPNVKRLKKLEICNVFKIMTKPSAAPTRYFTDKSNLSVVRYPIFLNQLGRSQIERLESDDENDLDVQVPRRVFSLTVSRTVKCAYVPKVKKFQVQRQESLFFSARAKQRNKSKAKKLAIFKMQAFFYHPLKEKLTCQGFKILRLNTCLLEKTVFNGFSFRSELLLKKIKGFTIFPEENEFTDASIDLGSEKGRKPRKTTKRASAIEEYFTLVIEKQTFQAVKLNFTEKDKIYMIKSADLYSKVQQLKLPFNFWHDWIKEQFNFLCTNK